MFVDDAALYASSREGFEAVASSFIMVAKEWGLTVNLAKSKGMVAGTAVDSAMLSPLTIEGGVIDIVESFQYLGNTISSDGELQVEVFRWLAKAAGIFEYLRQSIFADEFLSVDTCRCVYLATVVATLLYGSETWAVKARQVWCLEVFHNWCVRGILGATRLHQWRDHPSSEDLTLQFGMPNGLDVLVTQHQLQWLGQVGRMNDDRLPKQLLFGELLPT